MVARELPFRATDGRSVPDRQRRRHLGDGAPDRPAGERADHGRRAGDEPAVERPLRRELAGGGGDHVEPAGGREHEPPGGQGATGHRTPPPRPERADDREQLPSDAVRRGPRRPSVEPGGGARSPPDRHRRDARRPVGRRSPAGPRRRADRGVLGGRHPAAPAAAGRRAAGSPRRSVPVRQRRARRGVRPPGRPGDRRPLLDGLRPPVRRRQRPDGSGPLLLGDAAATATGWPSTCRSLPSSAERRSSTPGRTCTPRPTGTTSPTS